MVVTLIRGIFPRKGFLVGYLPIRIGCATNINHQETTCLNHPSGQSIAGLHQGRFYKPSKATDYIPDRTWFLQERRWDEGICYECCFFWFWTTTCKSLVRLCTAVCLGNQRQENGRARCVALAQRKSCLEKCGLNLKLISPSCCQLQKPKAAMDRQFRQWQLLQGQAAEDFHASTEIPLYSFQTIHCLSCQHVSRCEILWRQEIPSWVVVVAVGPILLVRAQGWLPHSSPLDWRRGARLSCSHSDRTNLGPHFSKLAWRWDPGYFI